MSGWGRDDGIGSQKYPSIGSAASKILDPIDAAVPITIGLAEPTKHKPWSEVGSAGYLGDAHKAFQPNSDMIDDLILKIEQDRFVNRKKLLTTLGGITTVLNNTNTFNEEAFNVLTSNKLLDALDLSKEDPKIRERYGDGKPFKYQYDGAPTVNEHLLIARRLVEAGARSVSLSYGRWDSHSANFDLVRDHGPKLDQCVSALVEDLEQRGMLNDVTVIVWGEFGRTPKINKGAGRDHWPQVSCALLAGGDFHHGQVIGATNKLGERATDRPVHKQEICATLYRGLGIDTASQVIVDNAGRPNYLLEHRDPLEELI